MMLKLNGDEKANSTLAIQLGCPYLLFMDQKQGHVIPIERVIDLTFTNALSKQEDVFEKMPLVPPNDPRYYSPSSVLLQQFPVLLPGKSYRLGLQANP